MLLLLLVPMSFDFYQLIQVNCRIMAKNKANFIIQQLENELHMASKNPHLVHFKVTSTIEIPVNSCNIGLSDSITNRVEKHFSQFTVHEHCLGQSHYWSLKLKSEFTPCFVNGS